MYHVCKQLNTAINKVNGRIEALLLSMFRYLFQIYTSPRCNCDQRECLFKLMQVIKVNVLGETAIVCSCFFLLVRLTLVTVSLYQRFKVEL